MGLEEPSREKSGSLSSKKRFVAQPKPRNVSVLSALANFRVDGNSEATAESR
jgi:hypothetical protein